MSERRDIELESNPDGAVGFSGRSMIAVIGIDRYHHWRPLANAVRDANGAAVLFQRLGFEQITEPLLEDRATGRAIQSLVTDDLKALGPDDSLVLFYAGHGATQKHRLGDRVIKTGYLIPVDAQDKVATWIDLEGWLRAVALLPAKHILVVLDACHSGIALDPILKWRDQGSPQDEPLAALRARRSRRIITSALDDQVALDSGPVHGHSLFTGCLIEGLTHGIRRGSRVVTGAELGLYVQQRVVTYPESRQTPDFGTFALDDRGEMVMPILIEWLEESAAILESAPLSGSRHDNMSESPFDTEPVASLKSGLLNGLRREDASEPPFDTEPVASLKSGLLNGLRCEDTSEPPFDTEPVASLKSGLLNGLRRGNAFESSFDTELTVAVSALLHELHHADIPESRCDTDPVTVLEPGRLNGARHNDTSEPSDVELPCENLATEMVSTPEPSVGHVSRDDGRRWLIGAISAMIAVILSALLPYTVDSKRSPIGDPAHVATASPHDDPPANAVLDVTARGLSDRQSLSEQPVKPPPGNCPTGMVPVPAGTFWMGSPEGVGDADERPVHEVTLSAYCIDRTEVTVKEYADCVAAGGCTAAPCTVQCSRFCNYDNQPDYPIKCVDWNQAEAYCTWAGRRLPTEAEWEYAARGTDRRLYPWGNEAPTAKRLNASGSEYVAMAKRELNEHWQSMYDASDGWETTAPVGSFPDGASPFGVLDMAGNVWEWTADWYGTYSAAATKNPRGAKTGTVRVSRGGGWLSSDVRVVRAAFRSGFEPTVRNYYVGFRCARGDIGDRER